MWGKSDLRSERPTDFPGKVLIGASGPRSVADSRGTVDRPRVEVWPVPRLAKLDGFRSGLNDEQRELATRYVPLAESQATHYGTAYDLDPDELRSTAYLALVEAAGRLILRGRSISPRLRGTESAAALRDYLAVCDVSKLAPRCVASPPVSDA